MLCSAQGHTAVTLGNRVNKISVEDLQKQKGERSPGSQGQEQVPAPVDLLLATRGHFLLPVRFLIPWFFSLN